MASRRRICVVVVALGALLLLLAGDIVPTGSENDVHTSAAAVGDSQFEGEKNGSNAAMGRPSSLIVADVVQGTPSRFFHTSPTTPGAVLHTRATTEPLATRQFSPPWWANPPRHPLLKQCRQKTTAPNRTTTSCIPAEKVFLGPKTLEQTATLANACLVTVGCNARNATNNTIVSIPTLHSTRRVLPFYPFSADPLVWHEAIKNENAADLTDSLRSVMAQKYLKKLTEEYYTAELPRRTLPADVMSHFLRKAFRVTHPFVLERMKRGLMVPFYMHPYPQRLFDPDAWLGNGGTAADPDDTGVDAPAYLATRRLHTSAQGVPTSRDEAADIGEPSKNQLKRQHLPWLTRFVQRKIAASQSFSKEEIAAAHKSHPNPKATHADIIHHLCSTTPILYQRVGRSGLGLGGGINILARHLGHAIYLGRKLTLMKHFSPWTGQEKVCASRGWECFFLPPSPCTASLINIKPEDLKSVSVNTNVSSVTSRVVMRDKLERNKYLSTWQLPEDWMVLPAGVTKDDVTRVVGTTYDTWLMSQFVRYLMRGMQPWAEEMVLALMEQSGYPWMESRVQQGERR